MDLLPDEPIKLTRDCPAVAVPAGHTLTLPQGTEVMITQSLGGSYTLLVPSYGGLFRLSDRDVDALGREKRSAGESGGRPPPAVALSGQRLEKSRHENRESSDHTEMPGKIGDVGLLYELPIDHFSVR